MPTFTPSRSPSPLFPLCDRGIFISTVTARCPQELRRSIALYLKERVSAEFRETELRTTDLETVTDLLFDIATEMYETIETVPTYPPTLAFVARFSVPGVPHYVVLTSAREDVTVEQADLGIALMEEMNLQLVTLTSECDGSTIWSSLCHNPWQREDGYTESSPVL